LLTRGFSRHPPRVARGTIPAERAYWGISKEFDTMADAKMKTVPGSVTPGTVRRVDRESINIDEIHALHDWSKKLGVTSWEVKAAVRKVGPNPKDVARALGSNARV
jgi:hypothetical protein